MSYTLILSAKASEDVSETAAYYATIRKELGVRFLDALNVSLDTLAHNPQMFQKRVDKLRRASVGKFPYSIIYYIQEPSEVIVTAVIHQHRPPESWTP